MYFSTSISYIIILSPLILLALLATIGIVLYRHPSKLQRKWYSVSFKKRKRIKQIADIAVDYIPEISGAAAGAAFGSPVVGAVIGTAAKRLLKRFMIARTKKLNFEEAIQYNIERFGNATIAASGNLKKQKESDDFRANTTITYSSNTMCTDLPKYFSAAKVTYNR